MGLLDFKVDVVLARLEADFSDQPPSIPAVPNHRVSLHCPNAKYPRSAQPLVSSQCPTAKYPCSVQLQSITAMPNCRVSRQCPATKYPCRAQPKSIPAVPNRGVPNGRVSIFLQRSCSAARKTVEGGGKETLHFLCNNCFRVGMLEVNNSCFSRQQLQSKGQHVFFHFCAQEAQPMFFYCW